LTGQNPDWPSWTTMNFDLTPWAGQNVMIGFHYMTDWGVTYSGWWIQNPPHVGGTELTLTPYVLSPPASFQVTTVTVHNVDGKTEYIPNIMPIKSPTNTGTAVEQTTKPNYVILVVTPTMPKGWADYQFRVTRLPTRTVGGPAGYRIAEPKSDY